MITSYQQTKTGYPKSGQWSVFVQQNIPAYLFSSSRHNLGPLLTPNAVAYPSQAYLEDHPS